jgi:aspartate aminotransferase
LRNELASRIGRIRPSATVSITALATRMREQGRDVLSLSAGEPDFPTPEHVIAAAIDAIHSGDTRYTPVAGSTRFRSAVAAKFRRENGLDCSADEVLVSSGAKQSCYNACQALLGPGDEAIVLAPYWVSYPDMIRLAGAEPLIVETTAANDFRLMPEQLEAAITPRTRLLFLNSPCNPTGAVHSREHWQALGEVLARHPRIHVLSDDIYEHIYWADFPFTTFAAACPDLADRTITVNGVSKCYAMSGWRIGYAAGPKTVINAMIAIQSQSTTSACTISQAAACAALEGDQSCVQEMSRAFRERHDFVVAAMNRIPGFSCTATGGTFYAFPRIDDALRAQGIASDTEFCEQLLERVGVALVPGSAFGAPGYLRMSFAVGRSTLEDALDRIGRFVAS